MSSILYIHGFASSSQGMKGQTIMSAMDKRGLGSYISVPSLNNYSPLESIRQLEEAIHQLGQPCLVASSLGGYYATYLAEKYHLKALLMNPVVLPHKYLIHSYKGKRHNGSLLKLLETLFIAAGDEVSQQLIKERITALAALEVAPPKEAKRYKVWLKEGDEVLDYQYALQWYAGCSVEVESGGDHYFTDFAQRIPDVLRWAGFEGDVLKSFDE